MSSIVIPALTFFTERGEIDLLANQSYAATLEKLAVPLILFGTTGEGAWLSPDEKVRLIEIYATTTLELCLVLDPVTEEYIASDFGDRANVMHRPWPGSVEEFVRFHRAGNHLWGIYSHPRQTEAPLTASLLSSLAAAHSIPWGAKVSKVGSETVAEMRQVVGPKFQLWHGTDRDIRGSIAAGADRIVSQTLASGVQLPGSLSSTQELIDRIRLDGPSKIRRLKQMAIAASEIRNATAWVQYP